jgi:hypothetical protein
VLQSVEREEYGDMYTVSDVFVWRSVFLVTMLATLLVGVGLWRLILWIRRRRPLSSQLLTAPAQGRGGKLQRALSVAASIVVN